MPRLVAVALYHRDHFSQGSARWTFGPDAYHWAVVVMSPKCEDGERFVFDATDTSNIDPVTFRLINPAMEWRFRAQATEDASLAAKLIGHLVIGEISDAMSMDELTSFLSTVPLPVKNSNPQENCVTWVNKAIMALQEQGWLHGVDVRQLQSFATAFADEKLRTGSREPMVRHYSDFRGGSSVGKA